MSLVIAAAGPVGCGKNSFANCLGTIIPTRSIVKRSFGGIVTHTLKFWRLETTRQNHTKLYALMREQFGPTVLTDAVRDHLTADCTHDIIVLDGVRLQEDVDMVKSLPNKILVYIDADPEVRYQRILLRREKDGEENTTREDFAKMEASVTERYIPQIKSQCDAVLDNSGTAEKFRRQIVAFCQQHLVLSEVH